jgi:hypothetical protein
MSEYRPEDYVDLNLDEIEREQSEVKAPFAFTLEGHRFTLTDPADLDWKQLLEIDDPIAFFRYCMPQDQKDTFKALEVPGWKLGKIIEAFQKHFGLGSKGNAAASRI